MKGTEDTENSPFGCGQQPRCALIAALCLILVALLAIVLCGRGLLGQGGKDLAATLLPFAFALVLWAIIRKLPSHILDQILFVSAFILVLLGIGRLTILIVRSIRFR